jgi:hypothetical protein
VDQEAPVRDLLALLLIGLFAMISFGCEIRMLIDGKVHTFQIPQGRK